MLPVRVRTKNPAGASSEAGRAGGDLLPLAAAFVDEASFIID